MPCYKFAPGVYPNTFIFPTDNGWLYSVAFLNNLSLFKGNEILENNKLSFEIVFNRSELDKAEKRKDPLVASTISTILCKQFDLLGELPIYFFLCDMADKRGFARSQLFNQWYESCDVPYWEPAAIIGVHGELRVAAAADSCIVAVQPSCHGEGLWYSAAACTSSAGCGTCTCTYRSTSLFPPALT